MSRLPRITGDKLLSVLKRNGFSLLHVRGSHNYLESPNGRLVCIPVHSGKILKPKTLKSILEQSNLSVDELVRIL